MAPNVPGIDDGEFASGFDSRQDHKQVSEIFPKCKGIACQDQHH